MFDMHVCVRVYVSISPYKIYPFFDAILEFISRNTILCDLIIEMCLTNLIGREKKNVFSF